MVPDIHARVHNQPFIMRRAIWRHVFGHTDSLTHNGFIISHSSCVEQYGDMSSDTHTQLNGSPPKFDTLLASWYLTYMQGFIISHSSCVEQYGDMSSDTHTQLNGSPPKFDTLLASWYLTYMQSFIISHSSCA